MWIDLSSVTNNLQHDILAFTVDDRPHFDKVRILGMGKIRVQEYLKL